MKLGVLADVHGNALALAAVLDAATRRGIDRFLCAGDYIGYYYEPARCVDLVAQSAMSCVRGNHEDLLQEVLETDSAAAAVRARYGSGLDLAAAELSDQQTSFLAALPAQREITIDGVRILLCHGTPWDNDQYVYPDADDDLLARCAESRPDYVILGHTHHRMIRHSGATVIVNPGSVGQPRDRRPGAAWAVLDLTTRTVEHCTEPYDAAPLIVAAQGRDPHLPYLWSVLSRR